MTRAKLVQFIIDENLNTMETHDREQRDIDSVILDPETFLDENMDEVIELYTITNILSNKG